jgi:hypothetical protein
MGCNCGRHKSPAHAVTRGSRPQIGPGPSVKPMHHTPMQMRELKAQSVSRPIAPPVAGGLDKERRLAEKRRRDILLAKLGRR